MRRLAQEQRQPGFTLIVDWFPLHVRNTPAAAQLAYLPEAHCYLRHPALGILEATTPTASGRDFAADLLAETAIGPTQIGAAKIQVHRAYLAAWLRQQPALAYTIDELWA